MFKCPACGNTKKFIVDVIGTAIYYQEEESFGAVDSVDFNTESGWISCRECHFQASLDIFEEEGEKRMTETFEDVLIKRDNMTQEEAEFEKDSVFERILDGEDYEDVLSEYGLEPDYLESILM